MTSKKVSIACKVSRSFMKDVSLASIDYAQIARVARY